MPGLLADCSTMKFVKTCLPERKINVTAMEEFRDSEDRVGHLSTVECCPAKVYFCFFCEARFDDRLRLQFHQEKCEHRSAGMEMLLFPAFSESRRAEKRELLKNLDLVTVGKAEVLARSKRADVVCDVIMVDDSDEGEALDQESSRASVSLIPLRLIDTKELHETRRRSVKFQHVTQKLTTGNGNQLGGHDGGNYPRISQRYVEKLMRVDLCSPLGDRLRHHVASACSGGAYLRVGVDDYERHCSSTQVDDVCEPLTPNYFDAAPTSRNRNLRRHQSTSNQYLVTFRRSRFSGASRQYCHTYRFTTKRSAKFFRSLDRKLNSAAKVNLLAKLCRPCCVALQRIPLCAATDVDESQRLEPLFVSSPERKCFEFGVSCADYTSLATKNSAEFPMCFNRLPDNTGDVRYSSQSRAVLEKDNSMKLGAECGKLIVSAEEMEILQYEDNVSFQEKCSSFELGAKSDTNCVIRFNKSNFSVADYSDKPPDQNVDSNVISINSDSESEEVSNDRSVKSRRRLQTGNTGQAPSNNTSSCNIHRLTDSDACVVTRSDGQLFAQLWNTPSSVLPAVTFRCDVCNNTMACPPERCRSVITGHYAEHHGITDVTVSVEVPPSGRGVVVKLVQRFPKACLHSGNDEDERFRLPPSVDSRQIIALGRNGELTCYADSCHSRQTAPSQSKPVDCNLKQQTSSSSMRTTKRVTWPNRFGLASAERTGRFAGDERTSLLTSFPDETEVAAESSTVTMTSSLVPAHVSQAVSRSVDPLRPSASSASPRIGLLTSGSGPHSQASGCLSSRSAGATVRLANGVPGPGSKVSFKLPPAIVSQTEPVVGSSQCYKPNIWDRPLTAVRNLLSKDSSSCVQFPLPVSEAVSSGRVDRTKTSTVTDCPELICLD